MGNAVTDMHRIRALERLTNVLQISNAELAAILKALCLFEEMGRENEVILTDSMNSCKWLRNGNEDNYPSHAGLKGNEMVARRYSLMKLEEILRLKEIS